MKTEITWQVWWPNRNGDGINPGSGEVKDRATAEKYIRKGDSLVRIVKMYTVVAPSPDKESH